MIQEAVKTLSKSQNLTYGQAEAAVNEIMDGKTSQAQTAAFLTALAMKGESIEEITGCAVGMRHHALAVPYTKEVLDIVGTGGDGSNTFNISTVSAFVIAAAGVKVGKHGNRAASSKCGAADVLEALGAEIRQSPEACAEMLDTVGMCFFFAQLYHQAMKYVAPVRREIGIRTIFNILGPLTNPAGASRCVIGVYNEAVTGSVAHVLAQLGVSRGMVVYGKDEMDEISASAPTLVCDIDHGEFSTFTIEPEDFGLKRGKKEDLIGGTAEENAKIAKEILSGSADGVNASRRTAVLLNAGAGIYIGGQAPDMLTGVDMAAELIRSGAAFRKMEEFVTASRREA